MALQMRLSEILQRINDAKTEDERIRLLAQKYLNLVKTYNPNDETGNPLKVILGHAFDHRVKFKLWEGVTPGQVAGTDANPGDLYRALRSITVYTNSHLHNNLNKMKIEDHWMKMMSIIHPEDRKMMDAVKNKDLPSLYPNITLELVKKALPKFAKDFKPIPKKEKVNEVQKVSDLSVEKTEEKVKPKRSRGRPRTRNLNKTET